MTLILKRKVGILHRSSSEGYIKESENLCGIPEDEFENAKILLRAGGKWTCSVCGTVTISDVKSKKINPMISTWGFIGFDVKKK